MTDTAAPPPGPSGYQPAAGEGFAFIDVEVRPSIGFQTVGLTARLVFPEPRSYAEALPAVEETRLQLEELALAAVDGLVKVREEREGKKRPAPAAPAPAAPQAPAQPGQLPPSQPGQLPWAKGIKPNGHGDFKFLPTSYLSQDDFIAQAKAQLPALGIPADDVKVFDNRTGNYGLEGGHESYSPGVVKVNDDSQLASAMQGKKILGNVDFDYSTGAIQVRLTKDGNSAIQALTIAQQLGGQQVAQQAAPQAPPQAPPPTDADMPF